MILPPVQGSFAQSDYCIYTACDQNYFAQFGSQLINSVLSNTTLGIHIHVYNPTLEQLNFCQKKSRVSVTWETVDDYQFSACVQYWHQSRSDPMEQDRLRRTHNAMQKGQDSGLHERMKKTYYACARFIRLSEFFSGEFAVLAVDVDAVVRKQPPLLDCCHDFYLHKITGKKARILAGGMMLHPQSGSKKFIDHYASELSNSLEKDYVYWGLDQDLLDCVVPNYNHGHLPLEYIDWHMLSDSYIWTAKGTRKEDKEFVNEQKKYSV